MTIWKNPIDIESLNRLRQNTIVSTVGIEFTELGTDYLCATMPVNDKTRQPYGLLHGGASVVLAETLGSTAGQLCVDMQHYRCFGLEINANHVRPVSQGMVTGTARPKHVGRSTHVWEIEIKNDAGKLACVSRITLSVLKNNTA